MVYKPENLKKNCRIERQSKKKGFSFICIKINRLLELPWLNFIAKPESKYKVSKEHEHTEW